MDQFLILTNIQVAACLITYLSLINHAIIDIYLFPVYMMGLINCLSLLLKINAGKGITESQFGYYYNYLWQSQLWVLVFVVMGIFSNYSAYGSTLFCFMLAKNIIWMYN